MENYKYCEDCDMEVPYHYEEVASFHDRELTYDVSVCDHCDMTIDEV